MNELSMKTKKLIIRLGLIFLSLLVVTILFEIIFSVFGFEERYVRQIIPVMNKELQTHIPDPDPRILLSLKPNSSAEYEQHFGPFKVTVNSLGFRGRERSVTKSPGVFRIICVGGSNVYGAGINDDQTWPAQLETKLNAQSPGRYEVWNLGVSGYNALSMIAVTEKAIEQYDPNLIIFALYNTGPRYFLVGTSSVSDYFKKDPTLWLDFIAEPLLRSYSQLSTKRSLWLLGHSAIFRFWVASNIIQQRNMRQFHHAYQDAHYIDPTREFLQSVPKKVSLMVFICPAVQLKQTFDAYYTGIDVPVFTLRADWLPTTYQMTHPPPNVMDWYATHLIRWMGGQGLLSKTD